MGSRHMRSKEVLMQIKEAIIRLKKKLNRPDNIGKIYRFFSLTKYLNTWSLKKKANAWRTNQKAFPP